MSNWYLAENPKILGEKYRKLSEINKSRHHVPDKINENLLTP